MGRPKKPVGNFKSVTCVVCDKEIIEGYKLIITIKPISITSDFFMEMDPEIEDYDVFVCGKDCIVKYVQEVLNVEGNGGVKG